MDFVKKYWNVENGVGIDINPQKVEQTRALGYQAELADLTQPLNFSGTVQFSVLSHVLEHIPSALLAEKILKTAAMISSEFFLVRQPWFDSDGLLAQLGLKLYWSDWPGGHTNHMTSLQFYSFLKQLRDEGLIAGFSIWGNDPIISTSHSGIVPLDSPRDRHHYDAETDASKDIFDLPFACYKEIMAYVAVAKNVDITTLPTPFANATLLLRSPGGGPTHQDS